MVKHDNKKEKLQIIDTSSKCVDGVIIDVWSQKEQKSINVCAKDLQIEVFESYFKDGKINQTPTKIVNEKEFLQLYDKADLRMLLQNGEEGDAIGQGRWFHGKLLNKEHI